MSKAMGDRFEWFCVELLRRYFERLGIRVTHTGCRWSFRRKISDEAYNSAENSEHVIIVTTYRNMCRNIKNLIAGLSQEFRALEERRRFLEDRCRFLEYR
ncbi:35360_t:CDS:2, partial [Gigaspora margarita]